MKDSFCCQSKRQILPWGKFFTPLSKLFLPAEKVTGIPPSAKLSISKPEQI